MMELLQTIAEAKGAVLAIVAISGAAIGLDVRHAPREQVMRLESSARVNTIQGWIRVARDEGSSEYICDAIRSELISLCTEQKEHYLCSDKARADTLRRAGCG